MKRFLLLLVAISCVLFFGCTNDLYLKVNKDGSVDVKYSTSAGTALAEMLEGFVSSTDSGELFNPDDISKDFTACGFNNVKVAKIGNNGFTSTMSDNSHKSPLFSSGILTIKGSSAVIKISPKQLFDFYNDSDQQTQMLLDMVLAPVFNDEEMSEAEYIETVSSVYGVSVGNEIKSSKVNIVLEDSNGKKISKTIPLIKLLTLEETILISN